MVLVETGDISAVAVHPEVGSHMQLKINSKTDQELGNAATVLLNAVKENYPDLASSDSVKTLMTRLEGSENRISVERKRYMDDVNEHDKKIGSFLMSLIAGPFGFDKIDQYQADKSAETVPIVDFD